MRNGKGAIPLPPTEEGESLLDYVENGLFELKECINDKTQWGGTQTMVTPKGRETFRLLCV